MKIFNCNVKDGKMNLPKILGLVLLGVFGAGAVITGLSFIVKALWNNLMPEIFGLKKISLMQALGLTVLTKLLFSSGSYSHSHNSSSGKKTKYVRKEVEVEKEPEIEQTPEPA